MSKNTGLVLVAVALLWGLRPDLSAQVDNQEQKEEEFPMPDYSGWPVEKSETLTHPENPNLSATAELRKNPKETQWLILTTLTMKGTDRSAVSKRAFYLNFSGKESNNTLVFSSLHPHENNKWFISEETLFELKIGPEDFKKVVNDIFDDLVSSFKKVA